MRKISAIILSILFVSCATQTKNKLVRIDNGVRTNSGMPNFYLSEQYLSKNNKTGRSLASTSTSSRFTEMDNKKVYFLTLFGQYKRLGMLGQNSNEIRVCPRFHHEIQEQSEFFNMLSRLHNQMKPKDYSRAYFQPDTLANFPELSLSITDEQNVYQYLESFKSNEVVESFVKLALEEHTSRIGSELKTLCEYGVSDNYYIYENLMTHFAGDENFESSIDSLKAVLKIPIFANLLILKSIDNSFLAYSSDQYKNVVKVAKNFSIFESEIIERHNMSWFLNYLHMIENNNKDLTAAKEITIKVVNE